MSWPKWNEWLGIELWGKPRFAKEIGVDVDGGWCEESCYVLMCINQN